MMIFKGNCELNLQHSPNWLVCVQEKGSMDEKLMIRWVKEVYLPFTEKDRSMLVLDSFSAHLTETVKKTRRRDNCVLAVIPGVALGDFNFPCINWDEWTTQHLMKTIFHMVLETLRDGFLHQHVHDITRLHYKQNASLLDLVITSDENTIENINYGDKLGTSDHHTDNKMSSKDLSQVNWHEIKDFKVSESRNFFHKHIQHCVNRFIPLDSKKRKLNKPRWMDYYFVRAVKKKYHAWNFTYTRNFRDYVEYCKLRNKASKAVYFSKNKHEKGIALYVGKNRKTLWSYFKDQTKSKSGSSDLKDKVTENIEKADVLNDFFSSVFTVESDAPLPDFDKRHQKEFLGDITLLVKTVLKHLQQLDPSKACSPDNCHTMFLKECACELSYPLFDISSKSIKEDKIPDDWKCADVISFHKKGSKSEPGNYCPVSLTSVVYKVLEKIIQESILEYLNKHKSISEKEKLRATPSNKLKKLRMVLSPYDVLEQILKEWLVEQRNNAYIVTHPTILLRSQAGKRLRSSRVQGIKQMVHSVHRSQWTLLTEANARLPEVAER
ncbi:hypothetical protein MAR_023762 [Mya arenaria]|uniref:DDE-1 domain-containing protein n=1 Tax=Mya arenaria TaxID=6604 RepID=A0ABY7DNW6_MYAAR|nr:hypothetical protein MAR_023762 [Mya arenaria]